MFNKEMEKLGKQPSAIRALFEYGKAQKNIVGEENVYDFSLGNPSIDAPKIVSDTLTKLIEEVPPCKLHGYTSAAGDLKTRESISTYINKTYKADTKASLIYMTCGAAASLTISFNAILNKGDEVIIFTPFFPEYKVFIEKANGKVVLCESDKNTFQPDFDKFEKSINENTKALIINSPNNPSGVVYTEETIKKLASILRKYEEKYNHEIYLISDEPYRELIYSDLEYPFTTNYYNDTIVCYSFSKSLSLPGERIGYILVSPKCKDSTDLFDAICGAGRSLGFVCAPAMYQYMIPSCLGYTSDLSVYKENLDDLNKMLDEIGYEVVKADGAFYLFMKALEEDAKAFSEKAKKYNLLLVPSDSFGVKGYVRIAYCVTNKQIKDSYNAFKDLYESYK